MRTLGSFFIAIFLFSNLILTPQPALGQTTTDLAMEELFNALDADLQDIYYSYYDFYVAHEQTDYTQFVPLFEAKLQAWESAYRASQKVYERYAQDPNQKVSSIALIALESSEKGISAIEAYREAITATELSGYMSKQRSANDLFLEAAELNDEAFAQLFKANGGWWQFGLLGFSALGTILMIIVTIILHFKSRTKSQSLYDQVHAEVYSRLKRGALAMTAGLAITAGTMVFSLFTGGSYFIMYGLFFFGLWKFASELFQYLTVGRNRLAEALSQMASNQYNAEIQPLSQNTVLPDYHDSENKPNSNPSSGSPLNPF